MNVFPTASTALGDKIHFKIMWLPFTNQSRSACIRYYVKARIFDGWWRYVNLFIKQPPWILIVFMITFHTDTTALVFLFNVSLPMHHKVSLHIEINNITHWNAYFLLSFLRGRYGLFTVCIQDDRGVNFIIVWIEKIWPLIIKWC